MCLCECVSPCAYMKDTSNDRYTRSYRSYVCDACVRVYVERWNGCSCACVACGLLLAQCAAFVNKEERRKNRTISIVCRRMRAWPYVYMRVCACEYVFECVTYDSLSFFSVSRINNLKEKFQKRYNNFPQKNARSHVETVAFSFVFFSIQCCEFSLLFSSCQFKCGPNLFPHLWCLERDHKQNKRVVNFESCHAVSMCL